MKKKVIKIRLDEELIDKLKIISEKENYPLATIISIITNDYINYYFFKKQKK